MAPGLINHQMLMLGQAETVFGTRAWNLVSLETMIDVIITIVLTITMVLSISQWEFQDPKMEVLYHMRPYFVGIFPYIGLI